MMMPRNSDTSSKGLKTSLSWICKARLLSWGESKETEGATVFADRGRYRSTASQSDIMYEQLTTIAWIASTYNYCMYHNHLYLHVCHPPGSFW